MDNGHACCSPSSSNASEDVVPLQPLSQNRLSTEGMALLPGGSFLMGADDFEIVPGDGEEPVREVMLRPFWIDRQAVSNAAFERFVSATAYTTEAERIGWSFVFGGLLPDDFPETRGVAEAPWWRQVFGADWRHPEGLQSTLDARLDHPVVHVSWDDAMAYCAWAAKRLPTEAEWEYAARGGLAQQRFPWGDELELGGVHHCNVWQGEFPSHNTVEDGYAGTAPVDAFEPNGFGLYNLCGNTWEWCSDWWGATHDGPRFDPAGPSTGAQRVQRGGSYLCHESYCNRYRVSARSSNTPVSATGHAGFRCAAGAR